MIGWIRSHIDQIVIACFVLWLAGFAYQTGRSTEHLEYRKKIEAANKSADGIQHQAHSSGTPPTPNQPSQPKAGDGGHEAPEVTFLTLKLGEALLAFVTVWLVLVTKGLVDQTKELVGGAEATARRQLRAYVHVKAADVQNMSDPSKRKVVILIENSGQTPAYELRFRVGEHVHEWPTNREINHLPDDIRVALGPLGPKGTNFIPVPVGPLSEWEENQLLGRKAGIYAWGEIEYVDCFDKPQRTWFSLVCEGDGLASGGMHLFGKGNGAT